ncbi:hypothetical protein TBLA_0D00260 [Henningerozyma blattae CBS 6284]|uniref:AN1-type domain-containing protein n=1 Tax=Henningerozyma blattae (strain ATCC 34711 / CBS 6284 / DSM 70876 / NBRC 10599 / NRRL Y-10934 / UCD 77-7) TaxID=1071380 RepID=I2H2D4_HENB6|nr:hypothetical protein TBLA_0D00260 [Tetrapisispora blattae CBS 6284]CCH60536.1 hypothetical protein TBLA_0D00260 [Tetrapisispora blattae CBS 6284]
MMEEGMLDVGTHCTFCRQLDFLPFHCDYCDKDFCSKHRTQQSHLCTSLPTQNSISHRTTANLTTNKGNGDKFFQSLLPDKAAVRLHTSGKPSSKTIANSNIKDKQNGTEQYPMKAYLNSSAKSRLLRFLKKMKQSSSKSSISDSKDTTHLLSNTTNIKPSIKRSHRITELSKVKKIAIGDKKIPEDKRLYVYCYIIDQDIDSPSPSSSTKKHVIFLDKNWVIGKNLDYIAKVLNVKNININSSTTQEEKLFLYNSVFPTNNDDFQAELLANNKKAMLMLKDLDTIYLVRGTDNFS